MTINSFVGFKLSLLLIRQAFWSDCLRLRHSLCVLPFLSNPLLLLIPKLLGLVSLLSFVVFGHIFHRLLQVVVNILEIWHRGVCLSDLRFKFFQAQPKWLLVASNDRLSLVLHRSLMDRCEREIVEFIWPPLKQRHIRLIVHELPSQQRVGHQTRVVVLLACVVDYTLMTRVEYLNEALEKSVVGHGLRLLNQSLLWPEVIVLH